MAKDPSPETAAETKPKGKGRLLIIIGVAVLLLGGGAGAYFFLKAPAEEKSATTKETAKNKAKKEPKAPAIYLALEPPFVSNFDPGSGPRFLQITVQLMTRDPHMIEFLEQNSPVIRNDLLLLFTNQQVEAVASREGKEKLRAAALEAIRKIIAAEGGEANELEAVYFTSFVMQ